MGKHNAIDVASEVASYYKVFTFADKILIAALISFSLISIFLIKAFVGEPSYISVEVNGKLKGRFRLSENQKISVDGKIGKTVILIENSDARVIEAPCPHKICMQKRIGDMIVCIPNGVIIRFKNDKGENQFDTISR